MVYKKHIIRKGLTCYKGQCLEAKCARMGHEAFPLRRNPPDSTLICSRAIPIHSLFQQKVNVYPLSVIKLFEANFSRKSIYPEMWFIIFSFDLEIKVFIDY